MTDDEHGIAGPDEDEYSRAIAAEAFGKALQARYRCGAGPLECGGSCARLKAHDGPCLCAGDTDGPGTCPA